MIYTREQVLANRQTWIDFQSTKGRKKAMSELDSGSGFRCCLGHACYALKIPKTGVSYGIVSDNSAAFLPDYVAEMLGMWTTWGDFDRDPDNTKPPIEMTEDMEGDAYGHVLINGRYLVSSLLVLNDDTSISAPAIGKYLATVIEGGYNTPFRPLSDYPETIEKKD